jgi:hypothetical protein
MIGSKKNKKKGQRRLSKLFEVRIADTNELMKNTLGLHEIS